MLNIDIMREIAALAGYTIDGTTGQDPINKLRAQRRLNIVKSDIISRYGGRWPSQYREGWIPLVPLYTDGTITATNASRTVVGSGTAWSSIYNGSKILIGGAYYKIASVTDGLTLVLTQPYQSTTNSGLSYQIWKDEYRVYPEALSIGGFVDYNAERTMDEAWPRNMKVSFPVPQTNDDPTVYTVIGRNGSTTPYTTGTISGTINDKFITGLGTSWLDNIEPGFEMIIGIYTYHVKCVLSDTSIELYQYLKVAISASTYTARGKNSLIIRFKEPTTQRIVHYWYWAKSYPLLNDSDEDWVLEVYSEVIMSGAVIKDYLDKNDVARANTSKLTYEDAIKNMKVSEDNAMTGTRTLGYNIPPEARD